MKNKVILISIDGMRPDGLKLCGHPYVEKLEEMSTFTYTGSSCNPSVTLPCHFSMTHSVSPERHGILTNTFVPQVRPVDGIFEKIKQAGGAGAMFYGWERLREIAKSGSLKFATYINSYTRESVDTLLTDEAIRVISEYKPDFAFLYMVDTDEKGGHDSGWMTEEYLKRICIAIDNTKRMIDTFGDEYTVIIMADHGGHDRTHGTTMPEDMTVPFFFIGDMFEKNKETDGISLLDIAPTIAKIMGVIRDEAWEGRSII